MQTDVAQIASLDRGQRLGHAVDKRLDADHAGARPCGRLCNHVFAAAEADLERISSTGTANSAARSAGAGCRDVDGEPRQQRLYELGLPRAQLVAFAPAEKGPSLMRFAIHDRRRLRACPGKVEAGFPKGHATEHIWLGLKRKRFNILGASPLPRVMRGLDPRIPIVPAQCPPKRDGRNKSGHDVCGVSTKRNKPS